MKVAAFNIQKFGRSKVASPDVLEILVKIVCRYDIIVILEVVDISGESVRIFLDALNKFDSNHHYTLKISSRLGRNAYKEQFMFLYRDDMVDLVGSYQFDDQMTERGDVFARDPYILRFRCLNTGGRHNFSVEGEFLSVPHSKSGSTPLHSESHVFRMTTTVLKDLVMIPVHTKPDDSENELNELYDVFLNVKKKWRTDNVMILGDFNADGQYVSKKDMKTIRIRSDKNFHWLIADDVDTTTSHRNDHTYDRIVVYGDDMLRAIVPNSARTFDFQKIFGLSYEQTLKVSDHYPVEVELKSLSYVEDQEEQVPALPPGMVAVDTDLMELKRGNLLLEREKLGLEIQILRAKMAKLNQVDVV